MKGPHTQEIEIGHKRRQLSDHSFNKFAYTEPKTNSSSPYVTHSSNISHPNNVSTYYGPREAV